MLNLSTEEKIRILKIALQSADLYDERVYKLQEYSHDLLNQVVCGEAECEDIYTAISELDDLIEGFKSMIYKYENYCSVINQVKFIT